MNFSRGTLRGSPYVGVFGTATEQFAIVPHSVHPKELKMIETQLEAKTIKASLGNSSLIGVLSKGIGNRLAVSSISEDSEIKALEKEGIEVLRVGGFTSTGNLIALNEKGGIASPLFSEKERETLEGFFGVKLEAMRVAESELCGACVTVTNKGFICHPNVSEEGFSRLEKLFGARGMPSTANYGDLFVGNSVIANSKGVIAGSITSGIELSKIDEGMRGE